MVILHWAVATYAGNIAFSGLATFAYLALCALVTPSDSEG